MTHLRLLPFVLVACTSSKAAEPPPAAKKPAEPPPAATKTIALDDIAVPGASAMGGTLKSEGPWHAAITVPAAATTSTTDTSTKYDPDGVADPQIDTPQWSLVVGHLADSADAVAGKYTSSGFKVLRKETTSRGYVVMVGSTRPLEIVVGNAALRLDCHVTLHDASDASIASAIASCESLAGR